MAALVSVILFFAVFTGSGCGGRPEDEPTKYTSQAGLEKLSREAAKKPGAGIGSVSDNPGFFLAKNTTSGTPTSKDIDSIIRPVLVRVFKDARLVLARGPEAPRWDGEVVEDRLVYSVKTVLIEGDGDRLHGAFRAAGFPSSPRLGSKPQHGRKNVTMSLFRSTSLRGYSFVINVDMAKQQIEVESYRLGSHYDRLM